MIDPHVHLRDWGQRAKETVRHGLETAWRAGLDGVLEMPNTSPPLITERAVRDRIALADRARAELFGAGGRWAGSTGVFHGLYAGLTARTDQIRTAVELHRSLFPRVVGLKLYAGSTTGDLGVLEESGQRTVLRTLAAEGFRGVLAVHCEKEALLRVDLWDPGVPRSHGRARPPEAEIESVRDMISSARETGFAGHLHVCHISAPEAVDLVDEAKQSGMRLSCGATPHHLLLSEEQVSGGPEGLLLKMNPPLRSERHRAALLSRLQAGKIDWIESDHAPHTLADKTDHPRRCPSGIPVLPIYPRLIRRLQARGMERERLHDLMHGSIVRIFGLRIEHTGRTGDPDLADEYAFDPFASLEDLSLEDLSLEDR